MLLINFIYDLAAVPRPRPEELDEEIDRLLYIITAEEPDYLMPPRDYDQLTSLDSEILSIWLTKKFKTALMLLLLGNDDNYQRAKQELLKMQRYQTFVDKSFRPILLRQHAMNQVREVYFADAHVPELNHVVTDFKRSLTFIARHLDEESNRDGTLLGTDRYTFADVTFYGFLKRILAGNYKDFGIASHLKLCDSLTMFAKRYAKKNTHVIDISSGDPLASNSTDSSIITDLVKPASIAGAFIMLYWYLRMR